MKKRIDVLLVEQGHFDSRERAKKAIMAGLVFVNNQRCDKAGVDVDENAKIEVKFTTNPSNKKVSTKCYYDKNIINFNNNVITPKRGGTTEFYCVAGFLNKTKSNVIDIEVK